MNIHRFLQAVLVIFMTWAGSASAMSPSISVDGREWLQPIDFINLSWNDISTVCDATSGYCNGTLNGNDITGWTWASVDDVESLFEYYVGSNVLDTPPPDSYTEQNSVWGPVFFAAGWQTTYCLDDCTLWKSLGGRARTEWDVSPTYAYYAHIGDIDQQLYPYPSGDGMATNVESKLEADPAIGAWIFRPSVDDDRDGVLNDVDNCPAKANPSQTDIDGDLAGDLCDVCPADPTIQCNPEGSAAGEATNQAGGTVATPDGQLKLVIDPGDLVEDTTISITEEFGKAPEVDLIIGTNAGEGQSIAFYDLEPDGLQFASTITMKLLVNVTALNSGQRSKLDVYRFEDTNGDGTEDKFVSLGAVCNVNEGPPSTFIATCEVQVDHFSDFAIVFPRDTDNDQVMDEFNGEVDNCRAKSNPLQEDANGDGCGDACIKAGCGGPFCSNP